MSFSIGDKVRFLNEKGEGTVTGFKNRLVLVMMEDGFEFPMTPEELVKVAEPGVKPTTKSSSAIGSKTIAPSIYLLYENFKQDGHKVRLSIVNAEEFTAAISIGLFESGAYKVYESFNLSRMEKRVISTFDIEEIEQWTNLRLQVLRVQKGQRMEDGTDATVRLKAYKFYYETSFTPTVLSSEPSIVVDLKLHQKPKDTFESKVSGTPPINKDEYIQPRKNSLPQQYYRSLKEKEVDLHIEELVDDMKGMTNGQMLQLQLKHFQKEMDNGFANHMHKIVFIHGVGNGVLKKEIRNLLQQYSNIEVLDGAYSKYGYGATEVVFKG